MMNEKNDKNLADLRQRAKELYDEGHLVESINWQINAINLAAYLDKTDVEDFFNLGLMFFAFRDFPNAIKSFETVYKLNPNRKDISLWLGICLIRMDRFDEAITHLKKTEKQVTNSLPLLVGLAEVSWRTGDIEGARYYGEKCLLIQDRLACETSHVNLVIKGLPPRFRADRPEKNVISFSLFGDKPRYLRGAIKNVIAAKEYYLGWRCRFYCDDTVPKKVLTEITKAGGDIKMMPRPQRFTDALFWRFQVAEDPFVDRFLVRDADSVINRKEQAAVNEWLVSSKFFHIMRDYCTHTSLILAGMWGGVAGVLPPLATLLKGFTYHLGIEQRTADQQFLGNVVWPLIKDNCLIHDSLYRIFNAMDFPPGSELLPGRHVGDYDFLFPSDPNPATTAGQ